MDHGGLAVFDLWNHPWRALGLPPIGLGRLLGLGPGGERFIPALVRGHGLPALDHDPGKKGHAEEVECIPVDLCIFPHDRSDLHDPKRRDLIRSFIWGECCHRKLVPLLQVGNHWLRPLPSLLSLQQPEGKPPARLPAVEGGGFFLQQSRPCRSRCLRLGVELASEPQFGLLFRDLDL